MSASRAFRCIIYYFAGCLYMDNNKLLAECKLINAESKLEERYKMIDVQLYGTNFPPSNYVRAKKHVKMGTGVLTPAFIEKVSGNEVAHTSVTVPRERCWDRCSGCKDSGCKDSGASLIFTATCTTACLFHTFLNLRSAGTY